jgi:hypothetical protein
VSEQATRPPRARGSERDLLAGWVLVVVGILALVGGVTAAVTGHIHGGRWAGVAETVYGVAMLWSARQVIGRLTWISFVIGAPLLLWAPQLDELLYGHAVHSWWPDLLAFLIVIEWLRRLIWPSRPRTASSLSSLAQGPGRNRGRG